jgi:hypothetical protein
MPYTVNVGFLDFGGFYGAGFPPMAGTLTPISSPGPPDTAASTPAGPTTLTFPSPASPPSGSSTVLVRDGGPPGDLFRSGAVTALPPSPSSLTVFTVPTASMSFASIAATAAGLPPFAAGIPTEATVLTSIFSAGTFIPLALTITGAIAPTSLTVTVTGALTARVFYFGVSTYTFTSTFTAAPAPSGDAVDRSRIVSVTATAPTLAGVPSPASVVLAPVIAAIAAAKLEGLINSTIASMASARLGSIGMRLSPTAVICARRVAVLSTGVSLQLTLSDLFGPAVLPAPKNFAVTVTPPPRAGIQQVYTVTVRDLATGAPVPLARVTLHNLAANGNQLSIGPRTTNASGQVTFDVELRLVRVARGSRNGRPRERDLVVATPTLTVELGGFNTRTMTLLTEDIEIN